MSRRGGLEAAQDDFDDALYLELNPDLTTINMDPRTHYLLWGQNEHRKYRHLDIAAASPL
jgi:hypothetical protein